MAEEANEVLEAMASVVRQGREVIASGGSIPARLALRDAIEHLDDVAIRSVLTSDFFARFKMRKTNEVGATREYLCSYCGVPAQSGPVPPLPALPVFPLPVGWRLVPNAGEGDDFLECKTCHDKPF